MPTFYENKAENFLSARKGSSLLNVPHLHNHLELVYLLDGATETFCDDQKEWMEPGDLFLAFPNQVHFYPPVGNGKAPHSLLIFPPSICSEFKEFFHRMTPTSAVVRKENLDPDSPQLIEKVILESQNDTLPRCRSAGISHRHLGKTVSLDGFSGRTEIRRDDAEKHLELLQQALRKTPVSGGSGKGVWGWEISYLPCFRGKVKNFLPRLRQRVAHQRCHKKIGVQSRSIDHRNCLRLRL